MSHDCSCEGCGLTIDKDYDTYPRCERCWRDWQAEMREHPDRFTEFDLQFLRKEESNEPR